MWWLLGTVLAILLLSFFMEIPRWRAVRPLYDRKCAGVQWRRRFPRATAKEIRDFLQLFVNAFGFPRKHRLKFRPTDRILDLYQARNPPDWTLSDSGEFECLFEDICEHYQVDLTPLWHENLTLGDVFAALPK